MGASSAPVAAVSIVSPAAAPVSASPSKTFVVPVGGLADVCLVLLGLVAAPILAIIIFVLGAWHSGVTAVRTLRS